MNSVLDASALLAYLEDEAGADVVVSAGWRRGAFLSAANFAEVLSKLAERGEEPQEVREELEQLGPGRTAQRRALDRARRPWRSPNSASSQNLSVISLGDRCCLALGMRLGLPVVTADRTWREAPVGVEMVFVR